MEKKTLEDKYIELLEASVESLVGDIATGKGIHNSQSSIDNIRLNIQQLSLLWQSSDTIPKRAALLFFDLPGSIQSHAHAYGEQSTDFEMLVDLSAILLEEITQALQD